MAVSEAFLLKLSTGRKLSVCLAQVNKDSGILVVAVKESASAGSPDASVLAGSVPEMQPTS